MKVYEILEATKGILVSGNKEDDICFFSQDSRQMKNGGMYIPLKGERFDGHDFIESAFQTGATAIITAKDVSYPDKIVIKVEDTYQALKDMAIYLRSHRPVKVVGVTGSVGKTSTKDIVANVVSQKYKTLKTQGNHNNNIGLPFTVLELEDEEAMVIEMGMNHFGELSYLTDIARPTIGVITNVGTAHIGNLGSRENIMKAKLEIIEGLNGPLIINNDNDIMHNNLDYIKSLNKVITVGIDNKSDYMAKDINNSTFIVENNKITSPINNTAFIYNSLVAYVVGKLCNISIPNIQKGIKANEFTSNRLEFKKTKNGVTIIDDTYNSSLDAIKSSLEILEKEPSKRKIAVVGDILEVGDYNKEIHENIGKLLLENKLDIIVTIGTDTKYTDKYLEENNYTNYYHFNNESESHEKIKELLHEGDAVLFKGSHAIKLGNIVKYLMEE